jgi:uncharacterized protein YlxP (DUF503 family)
MPIGLLTLELHLPYAQSLKDKRMVLQKLKARLRTRFNVSVAELDHQDVWQRSVIGIVSISSDQQNLEQVLQGVERESANILGGDLVAAHTEFL